MTTFNRVFGLCVISMGIVHGQESKEEYRFLEFPNAMPGSILKAKKEYNPATGRTEAKILVNGMLSQVNLAALETREAEILRAQRGALSAAVAAKVQGMGWLARLPVTIHLKYPPIRYPDKTQAGKDALQAASVAAADMAPITSLTSIYARHALSGMKSRGQGIAEGELSRLQLEALKSDPDVAAVEELREESLMAPELSSLASSAYNPGGVPSGSGAGVHAAIFENGLTAAFLSCIGVTPAMYDANSDGEPWNIRHADGTFRCLSATAPSASLYHRRSVTVDGANDINYLINNGIQTLSLSISRGNLSPYPSTYSEFLVMDDFAYRYPYPVFVNPAGNSGYSYGVNWQGYNGISVGNVRHSGTYEMAECTHAKNPPPIYGSCISGSGATCSGDREMPHIVVPAIPATGTDFASTCLDGSGTVKCATSWAAPTGNGIAADVISADSRMVSWPEKVRAAMILTAQNVDGGEWASGTDGRDGAGVVSGSEAVSFAQNHTQVFVGGSAAEKGMMAGSMYASDFSSGPKRFTYAVPNPKPSGKHLRVVLTWDSNPVVGGGVNALSDLDLSVQYNGTSRYSGSWDNNVEVVDIASSEVTAGGSYSIDVLPFSNRIPASGSRASYFYYAIAWSWVKDHAP